MCKRVNNNPWFQVFDDDKHYNDHHFFVVILSLQASSATNRMLESQSISELKTEIVSLKGLLLSR